MTSGEDRTAWVEQIDVVIPDRRTDRQRRRVVKAQLQTLEIKAQARLASDALRDVETRDTRRADADAAALRLDIKALHERAAKKAERAIALERELHEFEARARHAVTFRLHSEQHYVDVAEADYVRMSTEQRRSPIPILRQDGRQWWWFRDRFWWNHEQLTGSQVEIDILEQDLDSSLERHLLEEAQDAIFRGADPALGGRRLPDRVRRAVWQRSAGRCAECGSTLELRFEIVMRHDADEPHPDDVELRCRTCAALRAQPGSGSRGW